MNFEPAAHDIGKLMAELLRLIAGMNISPAAKKELLTKSFGAVGTEFYEKMFNDCSMLFDSTAIKTLGMSDLDNQTSRLAQKLIRNDALGRVTDQIVEGYFNSLLADAQNEAFKNAVSLGKVPTLTRSLRGETCEWCVARVGTWTNPSGELFARHDNCDCKIVVSGYKSRNGELKNYTKNSRKNDNIQNNKDSYRTIIFGNNKPGVGKDIVVEPSRANRKDDIEIARIFKEKHGGNYTVIGDKHKAEGIKSPDLYLENLSIFENKKITTSNAVDSQVRKAISQLSNDTIKELRIKNSEWMNRIIVLNIDDKVKDSDTEIMKKAIHRINRAKKHQEVNVDFIILLRSDGTERIYDV